ncbi:delta(3,5)-Delta(2,4)-dienoyl-CoA isomerase [Blastomyces parvus]|uniref:Delta(3,5)-Delta(2,4)-dienoyl-CoA isomerase n=1 Tax=Blastomyces parvus TaxID=2060905 RepID=A0A2B7WLU8_9EURO|nr:delta(3,5)-Delta(2,4)-dienoyl-CoA isomerase [Blastomyces parvus]
MAASAPSYKYFNVTFPQEYVAHVETNRPKKLNAYFEPMWLELRTIFDTLSASPDVRSIIFTGSGPAFTAGLDVKAASEGLLSAPAKSTTTDPARTAAKLRRHVADFQDCVTAIERCEKPVIIILHGISYGLAVDLACAADVRLCSADSKICVKEVDIGLAADIGTLSRLGKIVGSLGWVKETCMTARVFGAEEASRVGFVNEVLESKEAAVRAGLKIAGVMASKSPVAVQGTKELLNWSRDHSVQDGLRYTGVWNSASLQTSDIQRALLSGLEKRVPTFEKL